MLLIFEPENSLMSLSGYVFKAVMDVLENDLRAGYLAEVLRAVPYVGRPLVMIAAVS